MAFDTSWLKTTGLSAVQHAAAVALPLLGGKETGHLNGIDWGDFASITGGAALVSVLAAVIAYNLPGKTATALVSVPTAAVQTAQEAQALVPVVRDARGAR